MVSDDSRRAVDARQEADALARKELYEALHPQTRHWVAGASARWKAQADAGEETALASPTFHSWPAAPPR